MVWLFVPAPEDKAIVLFGTTVSVANVDVAEDVPHVPPLTTHEYVPAFALETLEMFKVSLFELGMFTPSNFHWYVNVPVPVAATKNMVFVPIQGVTETGCVTIAVTGLTVSTAVLDKTVPQLEMIETV